MLYLEDFLEVVEGIPAEVKEKVSEIKELDVGIHNTSESLDEQMKGFFNNAKRMKSGERAAAFEKIRRQYYKLLEDAEEKVSIASNLHDSLERYVRRIDVEIEKFKCELEADSPGITEVLEKKSLELDETFRENQKENRTSYSRSSTSSLLSMPDWRHNSHTKKEDPDPNLSSSLSLSPPVCSTSLSYALGHIGTGGNPVCVAATPHLRQGRRTATLSSSFDSVSHGVLPSDLSIGSELAHTTKAALSASSLSDSGGLTAGGWGSTLDAPSTLSARESTSTNSHSSSLTGSQPKRQKKGRTAVTLREAPSSDDLSQVAMIDPLLENADWTYDPNEPRYCLCNQVSYGNMVACDHPKCPHEWFHYPCVGITAPPKGKWYCPQCASSMNRRQRK